MYRVHLIGIVREEPRVTREYESVYVNSGGWLVCSNGTQVRWYPPQQVISVEKV